MNGSQIFGTEFKIGIIYAVFIKMKVFLKKYAFGAQFTKKNVLVKDLICGALNIPDIQVIQAIY